MKNLINIIGWSIFWIYAVIVLIQASIWKWRNTKKLTCEHGVVKGNKWDILLSCLKCKFHFVEEVGFKKDITEEQWFKKYIKEL